MMRTRYSEEQIIGILTEHDRGLVGLSDDLEILASRQTNDADAVEGMINLPATS